MQGRLAQMDKMYNNVQSSKLKETDEYRGMPFIFKGFLFLEKDVFQTLQK